MPLTCVLEPVRMKEFTNNYDEFRPHVDVNQKLGTRFLVMFLYLAEIKKEKQYFKFRHRNRM